MMKKAILLLLVTTSSLIYLHAQNVVNALSDRQYIEVKNAFDLFDKNGDQKISSEELANRLNETGRKISATEAQQMIAKKDMDKNAEEMRRESYAQSIGFEPYAATRDQTDPLLEGMKVLLDRIQQNEVRMNTLCKRLTALDPTFKKQNYDQHPFSDEELKIIEEVRRECEAQHKMSDA